MRDRRVVFSASAMLRALARALVRYAASGFGETRPSWQRLMETEVQRTASSVEALVWALGCVWAIRVEPSINQSRPELNCALLFLGLYLTVHYLVTHLTWYGLPPDRLEVFFAPRAFLKLAIFGCLTGVVAFVTPGHRSRRLFAGLTFPLLGMLGLLSVAAAFRVVSAIMPPPGSAGGEILARELCGLIFGVIVAMLLSLPCVLLYRGTAMPAAVLALVPAIAKRSATVGPSNLSADLYMSFLEQLWPFICSLFIIGLFCKICRRWVTRPPGQGGTSESM